MSVVASATVACAPWRVARFCVALNLVACFEPAAARVKQDREVGHATLGDFSVEVSGGLAAIRELSSSRLHLWASAPRIEFTLSNRNAGLQIRVDNCIPGSTLEASAAASPPLAVPRQVPTECAFEIGPLTRFAAFTLEPPPALPAQPFRIAVLSDVQEAIDRVQDIFERANREPGVLFMLGAGDLTEQGSKEELTRFQRELKALQVPYYTTLGNHELGVNPPAYHDIFGRGSFSFVFRSARFTLLDSASATLDVAVYKWLDGWLTEGKDQLHVVAMHIPPLDPTGTRNGAFASRGEAAKFLGRLANGRVDLTVYGHVHSYYHFDNAGIPAHISGGGGAIPERFDNIGRHFLVMDLDTASQSVATRIVSVD